MMLPDHEKYLSTKFFGSLNGLRCLSILGVIGYHAHSPNLFLNRVFSRGYLGVQLFFAISGFLITTLLLREKQAHGDISLKAFFIRRALRIFPLYYTVLFLYFFIVFFMEKDPIYAGQFWHNLPYYLSYTSNWFVDLAAPRVIFYFAWSLATEEQFYLVWSLVFRFFQKRWAIAAAGLAIIVSQTVQLGFLAEATHVVSDSNSFLLKVIQSVSLPILLGVMLAFILDSRTGYLVMRSIFQKLNAVVWFMILAFLAYIPAHITPFSVFLISFAMVGLVGSCVYCENHPLHSILGNKVVSHVGMVSYGMYLMHMLCLNAVRIFISGFPQWSHEWLEFPLCVVVTVAVASFSYRYYESIFLRWKEKFGRI